MATYAGQNVGAGKLDRVGKGLKSASFIGGIYAIIAFFVLSLFGRQIALLFVSADEIAMTARYQFTDILLGPRVLRTETTALTAITALQVRFGDLG